MLPKDKDIILRYFQRKILWCLICNMEGWRISPQHNREIYAILGKIDVMSVIRANTICLIIHVQQMVEIRMLQSIVVRCSSGKKKVCRPRLVWLDEMVKKYWRPGSEYLEKYSHGQRKMVPNCRAAQDKKKNWKKLKTGGLFSMSCFI